MTRKEMKEMRSWLKAIRKEKGMTLSEVALAVGISESYYCLIENNDRQKRMDISLISKISSVLDIPISEIIRLEQKEECN